MPSLRRATFAVAVAVAVLLGGTAQAAQRNEAVAINTTDGTDVFRLAFAMDTIEREEGEDIAPENLAYSHTKCTSCSATAIAIQIIFVVNEDDDDVGGGRVGPQNVALAVTEQCKDCQSVALAYQILVGVDDDFELSDDAIRRIEELRRKIAALEDEDLPPAELRARTDEYVKGIADILREEVSRPSDVDVDDEDDEGGDDEDGANGTASTPPPSGGSSSPPPASPSPAPSASPSPSPGTQP